MLSPPAMKCANTLTTFILPASNAGSISCEMENVAAWSRSNYLNINLKKTTEIIFYDSRRHQSLQFPPETPGITRTTVIKILSVSFTNSLSMSVHVQAVLGSSAQSLYAIKTLRSHGLSTALCIVFTVQSSLQGCFTQRAHGGVSQTSLTCNASTHSSAVA
jgi:hypothetical protein